MKNSTAGLPCVKFCLLIFIHFIQKRRQRIMQTDNNWWKLRWICCESVHCKHKSNRKKYINILFAADWNLNLKIDSSMWQWGVIIASLKLHLLLTSFISIIKKEETLKKEYHLRPRMAVQEWLQTKCVRKEIHKIFVRLKIIAKESDSLFLIFLLLKKAIKVETDNSILSALLPLIPDH